MHVLKLDTYRYVPIPPLRIGMYFGMYFCTYCGYVLIHAWYVLIHTSLYWSVSGTYFDSIRYVLHVLYLDSSKYIPQYMSQYIHQYGGVVLVCIQYIPVRIGMYVVCIYICIEYVLNYFQHDTFEYLIKYIPNTKVCIGMYYGMYVYVSGSVSCLYHTVFDIFYDDKYQYM